MGKMKDYADDLWAAEIKAAEAALDEEGDLANYDVTVGGEPVTVRGDPVTTGMSQNRSSALKEYIRALEAQKPSTAHVLVSKISRADARIAGALSKFSLAEPPRLSGWVHLADWFSIGMRKRLKAMLGDYDPEIRRLHDEQRFLVAHWNAWLARFTFIGIVLRGPWDCVTGVLVRAWRGGV